MRGIILAGAFLTPALVAIMVATEAEAQDTKDEAPKLKAPYTMLVTVKPWVAQQGKFREEFENTPAYWYTRDDGKKQDKDGNDLLAVSSKRAAVAESSAKSLITDRDGNVYVVVGYSGGRDAKTRITVEGGATLFAVKKAEKKD
jgi:hypothetical protein